MIDIMSTGFLFVWLFCCICLLIILGTVLFKYSKYLYVFYKYSKIIKPGDVWSIEWRDENPYRNNTITIVDTKRDIKNRLWVRYKYPYGGSDDHSWGTIDTELFSEFVKRHKFIK